MFVTADLHRLISNATQAAGLQPVSAAQGSGPKTAASDDLSSIKLNLDALD